MTQGAPLPTSPPGRYPTAVLHDDLLSWYDRHRRSLPWRDEVSPYRTWVSEIMLQQTRVDTVIDYFERFMARFPSVDALAAAPLDEVLSLWSGLGYYSRARNLHKAAGAVRERGGFPDTAATLRELPGVGAYTAGAIASIAFGRDEPAVDGNVERVMSRVHCFGGSRSGIEHLVREHLPAGRAGDFNQALMDLGSAICTPARPGCLHCPIAGHCEARRTGRVQDFPPKKVKRAVPRVEQVAVVWRRADRYLLGRRPEEGLFGGLFELPTGSRQGSAAQDARRLGRELLGVDLVPGKTLGTVRHTLTHRRFEVSVVDVRCNGEPASTVYTTLRWLGGDDLDDVGISTLTRKILRTTR